jgi:hypothetical protein
MAKCYFLYGGEQERQLDQIEILNFEKALWNLPALMGISDQWENISSSLSH